MADEYGEEDNTYPIQDDIELDCGVSREALVRDEFSGSVSILPSNGVTSKEKTIKKKCRYPIIIGVTVFVFLLGIGILIVALVLIARRPSCEKTRYDAYINMCIPSSEAKDSGFYQFLDKVQNFYYESFPNKILYKRPVDVNEIRQKFKIYDESPAAKQQFTDKCKELLQEVQDLHINRKKLSVRESKALSQVLHVLKYGLGYTYSMNYYAGDYMLLQNLWCSMVPICNVGSDLESGLRYFKPNTVEDLEVLRDVLKTVKIAFNQKVENLKYGVDAGMVPPIEACKASANGLRSRYIRIADSDEQGVFNEWFMKDILDEKFLSALSSNVTETKRWQEKHGKSINDSLRGYVLEFVGKPINDFFRYIREEYFTHCVPSNVSSGLASLPLDYVYTNGTADTAKPTTKRLPTGEVLDGKKTYEAIIGSFTTTNMTPNAIYDLGIEVRNELLPQIIDFAKKITKESDDNKALKVLKTNLGSNSTEHFYNSHPIPANESDDNAYRLCSNEINAKKYCPERWKAMEKYFADVAMINSLLDPKTISMFYFTGPKYSVPNCPITIVPEFNPSAPVPTYHPSGPDCQSNCLYRLPFFRKNIGPKWRILSYCTHEGRPGHHTQLQGYHERFRDTCGGSITWLDKLAIYFSFVEGWAVYAEYLASTGTNVYDSRPLAKYGYLLGQMERAHRLIIDTGLHYKGMTRSEARNQYSTDESELTRYQSTFGQATAYMIGRQHILNLRNHAKKELGPKFNLRDFHYHLLSQGNSPLSHLDEIIEQYISCTKDKKQAGCDVILNPPIRPDDAGTDEGVDGDYYYDPPQQLSPTFYY